MLFRERNKSTITYSNSSDKAKKGELIKEIQKKS